MPTTINASTLRDVLAVFSAKFAAGLQRGRFASSSQANMAQYRAKFMDLAMEIPSTGPEEVHLWLTQIPGFVEWIGDRIIHELKINGLRCANKDWAQTAKVPRNEIEDDKIAVYGPTFEAMGAEASDDAFLLDMVIDVLRTPGVWADGKAFFVNDRVYGGNTINNIIALALTRAVYKTAVSRMMGFKGDKDIELNVTPYMLLCGATVFWTAKSLMESQYLVESGVQVENDVRGTASVQWHPKLDADEWYLLGMKGSYKPLCAQVRRRPGQLVAKDALTDDNVFYAKEFVYGSDGRAAGLLPFPHQIILGYKSGVSAAPAPAATAAPEADAEGGTGKGKAK